MPTYDYKCSACGHTLDIFQPITARAKRKCPACGKMKLKRLPGIGAGIIFKGSGFYQTDYRSDSYKKGAEKEKPPAKPEGDSKPADGSKSKKTDSSSPATSGGESTKKEQNKQKD